MLRSILTAVAAGALSATVSAAPLLSPERMARGNQVVSGGDPEARITVPRSARHVGAERFVLYDVADCEIHVFVEAGANKQVRRFYWIQFEQYLPSVATARYDYASSGKHKATRLWNHTWWVRPRFGLASEVPSPGSDWERARGIIERAGYTLPPALMNVAMIRVLDGEESGKGRKELAIFYNEDMALSGHSFTDFVKDNAIDSARWEPASAALVKRAAQRIRVID